MYNYASLTKVWTLLVLQTHEVASLVYVKKGVGGTLHSDRAAFTNGANGGADCNMCDSTS